MIFTADDWCDMNDRAKESAELRSRLAASESQLTELRRQVASLKEALAFYANEENWCPIFCEGDVRTDILGDSDVKNYGEPDAYHFGGKRARAALAELEQRGEKT